MRCKRITTWTAWPTILMLLALAGCGAIEPGIPKEALKPLPDITLPKEPQLHTRKLLDDKGKPAGLLFPSEDAFQEAQYRNDLREAAEMGQANTRMANKIFEILRNK